MKLPKRFRLRTLFAAVTLAALMMGSSFEVSWDRPHSETYGRSYGGRAHLNVLGLTVLLIQYQHYGELATYCDFQILGMELLGWSSTDRKDFVRKPAPVYNPPTCEDEGG